MKWVRATSPQRLRVLPAKGIQVTTRPTCPEAPEPGPPPPEAQEPASRSAAGSAPEEPEPRGSEPPSPHRPQWLEGTGPPGALSRRAGRSSF